MCLYGFFTLCDVTRIYVVIERVDVSGIHGLITLPKSTSSIGN